MLFLPRMLLLSMHFIITSVLGLLVTLLRPFHPDNNRLLARMYALPALRILGVTIRLDAAGVLERSGPVVIVANHISNHDLFVFGPAVPTRTATLGKTSLKWIPLFGQLYWLAGNVLIDRGNAVQARRAMEATTDALLNKDMSIWVFAEGTRGHGRGLAPFKKGAFQMAINAGVPIVPLCANNYVRGWRLGRWHSGRIEIKALPPIPTQGLTMDDMPALMALCHARMRDCIEELDQRAGTAGRT